VADVAEATVATVLRAIRAYTERLFGKKTHGIRPLPCFS
jgi:hypothetical protein